MTSKVINLNNDNFDPKIKDLFDKASKTGQTNLAIKEFSELVEELTTLPIQNSKITFKTLNHILQDTKYDKHNLCDLSLILNTPFNFLNNKKQLLSFQQVLYIIDYADIKYTKDQLILAWIYYYLYKNNLLKSPTVVKITFIFSRRGCNSLSPFSISLQIFILRTMSSFISTNLI